MNNNMLLCIAIIIVSIIAIVMSSRALKDVKERFVAYTFGPIDPNLVDPYVSQSVFGQPAPMFDLSHNQADQLNGAWRAMQVLEDKSDFVLGTGIDWKTNTGFDGDGNTQFLMDLANPPFYAWRTF